MGSIIFNKFFLVIELIGLVSFYAKFLGIEFYVLLLLSGDGGRGRLESGAAPLEPTDVQVGRVMAKAFGRSKRIVIGKTRCFGMCLDQMVIFILMISLSFGNAPVRLIFIKMMLHVQLLTNRPRKNCRLKTQTKGQSRKLKNGGYPISQYHSTSANRALLRLLGLVISPELWNLRLPSGRVLHSLRGTLLG